MRRSEVIKGGHKKENRIIVVKEDRLKDGVIKYN
jgi:hypothetical protein